MSRYATIHDEATYNRFVSREIVEVEVMLDWTERGDYVAGAKLQIYFEAPGENRPSLLGEIVEELGVVKQMVEDINIHALSVRRVDPDLDVPADRSANLK